MEGTRLQRGDTFANQRAAAVNETGLYGAILHSRARNGVVVGFVWLAEVGCIGIGDGALLFHPEQGGGGVQPAGKGDADLLTRGQ